MLKNKIEKMLAQTEKMLAQNEKMLAQTEKMLAQKNINVFLTVLATNINYYRLYKNVSFLLYSIQ